MKTLKKLTKDELLKISGGRMETTGCTNTIYTDASDSYPCGDIRKIHTWDGEGSEELETLDFTFRNECYA